MISIGKSVIYAIAQRRPVFMYDHFGGDGWLTRDNFATNLYHNFSGRPRLRRLAPDALAAELLSGYGAAAQEAQRFGECVDLSRLHLDTPSPRALPRGRSRARPGPSSEVESIAMLTRCCSRPAAPAAEQQR